MTSPNDNAARNEKIVALHQVGLSYGEVAAQLRITRSTVAGVINRQGAQYKGSNRRIQPGEKFEAFILRGLGWPYRSISQALEIRPETLTKIFNDPSNDWVVALPVYQAMVQRMAEGCDE